MNYLEEREQNIYEFEDTLRFCEREQNILKAIQYSREHTMIWNRTERQEFEIGKRCPAQSYFMDLHQEDIFTKVMQLRENHSQGRIGIVILEQNCYPGGAVFQGGAGLEEDMCRCTTLYPCLNTDEIRLEYYDRKHIEEKEYGNITCIYIPDILCLKGSADASICSEDANRNRVDVIVCSAEDVVDRGRVQLISTFAGVYGVDSLIWGMTKKAKE